MAIIERLEGCHLGFDTSKSNIDNAVKAMASIGEIKVHVTACGLKELKHLLDMLEANIAVLPGVVVKAMQALADSVPADKEDAANV